MAIRSTRSKYGRMCWARRTVLLVAVVTLVFFLFCIYMHMFLKSGFASPQGLRDVGVRRAPPMGWNSWNKFSCNGLNEKVVMETASLLISTGLADSGYKFVNLDDCWQVSRNATGHIQPDPAKFPPKDHGDAMAVLGQDLHTMGLYFGIYTDVGPLTCQRRPGSYQYEMIDAQTYISWGVDFVKNDGCFVHPGQEVVPHFHKMHKALHGQTQRPIIHSIKNSAPIEEAPRVSHMRRVAMDVGDDWSMMMYEVDTMVEEELWMYSRSGFWNDMDMMEIGNGAMTEDEYITHMAIWCVLKSPLLLGNDLSKMDDFTLSLLKHKGFIAINQDSLGESARLVTQYYVEGSLSKSRMVMQPCDLSSTSQQWTYNDRDRQFKHVETGKCLTTESPEYWRYLIVADCDATLATQQWVLDLKEKEIHPADDAEKCITLMRENNAESRVRKCSATKDHDLNSHMFQEKIIFNQIAEKPNTYAFRNRKKRCATIGAKPDIMIFSGALSENRVVILLVNRDTGTHSVAVKASQIPEIDHDVQYSITDVYTGRNIGLISKGEKLDLKLKGHQSKTLILAEVKPQMHAAF